MFDSLSKEQVLSELRRKIDRPDSSPRRTPARLDREVLPVLGPLADVLPHGGLPRGAVVSVVGGRSPVGDRNGMPDRERGGGASSLLLSLLAAPTPRWSAVVGMPDIGLAAAAELGADLDRLVVVPDPGPDVLQVLSALADGVELIVLGASGGPYGTPARLRVLAGRLRQHGTVLLVAGQWPGADLVLQATHTGWTGIGQGTGRLRDRELAILVGGRRSGRPGRECVVRLSGRRDGTVALLETPARTESIGSAVQEAM